MREVRGFNVCKSRTEVFLAKWRGLCGCNPTMQSMDVTTRNTIILFSINLPLIKHLPLNAPRKKGRLHVFVCESINLGYR